MNLRNTGGICEELLTSLMVIEKECGLNAAQTLPPY